METESKPLHSLLRQAGLERLPTDWSAVVIEDLLIEDRGISVGVMYPGAHDPLGSPLIKAGDLTGATINPRPSFRISPKVHHEYRRTELEGGELLMTLVGNVGTCAVVPAAMRGWNAARAVAVMRFKVATDATFIRACLQSRQLRHLMDVWSNTTVQQTLNLKEIRRLPLPWPKRQERDRIAAVLGALDDKIEINRKMNETMEAIAQALFKSWFVDFDPVIDNALRAGNAIPSDLEDQVTCRRSAMALNSYQTPSYANLFPMTFETSDLGSIPSGWSPQPIPTLIQFSPRTPLKKGTVAKFVDMKAVPTGGSSISGFIEKELKSGGAKFRQGDTLLARITPCLENGKTALVDFLDHDEVAFGSTEFIVMRPEADFGHTWVYSLARSTVFRQFAISNMTGSSGRQRVPVNCFNKFRIPVPPPEILQEFHRATVTLFDRIKSNADESKTLSSLRDVLLPKLISGEVRVPETTNRAG